MGVEFFGDGSFNLATIVWESEKDRRLVHPVPFGCAIEDARDEDEKAIGNLAAEMSSISVMLKPKPGGKSNLAPTNHYILYGYLG